MNGLWTPQSAAITDPPMPQPATLWPSPRNVLWQQHSLFTVYQTSAAIYLVLASISAPRVRKKEAPYSWAEKVGRRGQAPQIPRPSSKRLRLRHFLLDQDEIWKDCSSSKYTSTDGVGFFMRHDDVRTPLAAYAAASAS